MNKQLVIGGVIGAAIVTLLMGASLTWLLFLACPLMMVFMHGGHDHGGHEHGSTEAVPEADPSADGTTHARHSAR